MFWGPSRAVRFALLEALCASAGLQGAAGASTGGTHCTACFGKGISCSKLELKLQDPLSRSVLLDTGTHLQLAVPVAGVTPVAQGALGSKGHTRVGDQVEICLFLLGRLFFLRCLVETVLCFQLECMQCPLDDSQMENVITCSASKCPHLFAIKHLKKHL